MKVFVTGVGGQLGFDVINELKNRGHQAIGSDIIDKDDDNYIKLDITDKQAVEKVISETKPDAVIHCAAWTAVDAAEDEENKDKVFAINSNGTRYIAQACKTVDCKMIYISTDYVFNGEGTEPWQPDCKDYAPLCVYGQSKLDGELAEADGYNALVKLKKDGRTLEVKFNPECAVPAVGSNVFLIIRPEKVKIVADDYTGEQFIGSIIESTYAGDTFHIVVRTDKGVDFKVKVFSRGKYDLSVGASIRIGLRCDDIVAVSE